MWSGRTTFVSQEDKTDPMQGKMAGQRHSVQRTACRRSEAAGKKTACHVEQNRRIEKVADVCLRGRRRSST